jgi:hypothetical protein
MILLGQRHKKGRILQGQQILPGQFSLQQNLKSSPKHVKCIFKRRKKRAV